MQSSTLPRLPWQLSLAFALTLASPMTALASDAALQKCRAMDDPFARLKCYDAIPVASGAKAPTPAPAQPVSASSAAAAAAPAALPVPASTPTASQFGLPAKVPDAEVNRIESHIVGKFEGWRANSNIRLANGQVWQVADDSARFLDLDNPKVAVRRGALTSFYLEIEGTNHSPRVRRVK